MAKPLNLSRSSKALDALLDSETREAKAIRVAFHRTILWKLRTGRRQPELATAVELQKLSRGLVQVTGWHFPERAA